MAKVELHDQDVMRGLDALGDGIAQHLARSMAVAGGKVFLDEARARAPVYRPAVSMLSLSALGRNGQWQRVNAKARPGELRDAMYLAYSEERSTRARKVYSVSWNSSKAPHGHLIEFGHWMVMGQRPKKGVKDTRKQLKWVPAYPFLRPAYDSASAPALKRMQQRGRERFDELRSGAQQTEGGDE